MENSLTVVLIIGILVVIVRSFVGRSGRTSAVKEDFILQKEQQRLEVEKESIPSKEKEKTTDEIEKYWNK